MSIMMVGQDFPDRIVTNKGDTIECCITLVNNQAVFFYYMGRDIRRPDRLNLNHIKDYNWTKNCSFEEFDEPYEVPEKGAKKWGYGLRIVQQFNMPITHSIMAFNLRKGNHNLYVGPHYTHISKRRISGDTDVSYNQNTYGINMGYQIVIKTRNEVFDVFMQLDVSLYEAQEWYYNGPYAKPVAKTRLVAENCISVGIKYNVSQKFEVFGGYGFGATEGFFFEFEEVIPQIYFGLHYNIK